MADVGIKISAVDASAGAFASATQNLRRFKTEADGLQDSIGNVAARLGTIGVAIGGAFAGASLKGAIDLADRMDDLAEKTGITVKELSGLRYASEVVGTPLESLATGLRKLSQNMAGAAGGAKEQLATFNAIGVSFKNLDGSLRGSEQVLGDIASKFTAFKDGPAKAALAVELFGKSGADLIPILNQGAAGIAELSKEGERLGAVFGGDLARQAADFNDNLKRISLAAEGAKLSIAGELLPTFNLLASSFIESKDGGTSWAKAVGGSLRTVTETVTILGSEINFMLQSMGRSLGGFAAQLELVANNKALLASQVASMGNMSSGNAASFATEIAGMTRLEYSAFKSFSDHLASLAKAKLTGFTSISEAVKEDAAKARAELDKFQSDVFNARYLTSKAGAGRGTAADPRIIGNTLTDAPIVTKPQTESAASEYDKLNKTISERLQLGAKEIAMGRTLTEQEKFSAKVIADMADAKGKLTAEQRASLAATLKEVEATDLLLQIQRSQNALAKDRATERQRQRNAEADSIAAYIAAERDAANASNKALADGNKALQDEILTLGLSAEALAAHEQAIIGNTIAEKEAEVARLDAAQAGQERAAQLRVEIDLLTQRKTLVARKAEATTVADAAKEAAAEWQRTANQVYEGLSDSLFRAFESGKGFFKTFWDGLKNTFKTTVLQLSVKGIMSGIAGSLGLSTLSGAASAANVASGAGSLGSMFQTGGSLASIGNLFAGASTALGQFGSAALASTQSLLGFTGTAAQATAAANAGIAAGTGGSTLAASIGTAMPYIAAAVAVYMAAKSLEGGEKRSGASYNIDPATGRTIKTQGPSGGEIAGDQVRAITDATTSQINTFLKAFGAKASLDGWMSGLESSTQGKGFVYAGGTIGGKSFGESDIAQKTLRPGTFSQEQALTEYTTDLQRSVIQALQVADLGGEIGRYVAAVGDVEQLTADAVTATLTQITAYQQLSDAVKALPFDQLKGLSVDASAGLLTLAGGLDALTGKLGTYYDNFYTDGERTAATTKALGASLGELGLALPTTREAFRQLVEAQDLTTEAGRKNYNALLNVAGVFASIVPAAEATSTAIKEVATTLGKTAEQIATEGASIQDRIDTLLGNTAALRERELAAIDPANRALQQRYYALQDEQAATQAASAALQTANEQARAIADERAGLQQRLWQLEGNTNALRQAELDALDPANRALQLRINALQDEQAASAAAQIEADKASAAAEKAAAAISAAAEQAAAGLAAAAKAIKDEYASLNTRILQAQGNTAALRGQELQKTDPANRAALLYLWAIEDQKAAQDAAFTALQRSIAAQKTALDAQKQIAQENITSLQAIFNTLGTNIDALYASVTTQQTQGAAAAQAFITQALATAKASGYLPDGAALSNAISAARTGISTTPYATKADADRANLILAGQLSQLKDIAGPQLTAAEAQLKATEAQTKALDDTLAAAQQSLDTLNGINTNVLSVADAIAAVNDAIKAGNEFNKATAANTYGLDKLARIKDAVNSLAWGDATNATSAQSLAATAKAMGWSSADIANALGFTLKQVLDGWQKYGISGISSGTLAGFVGGTQAGSISLGGASTFGAGSTATSTSANTNTATGSGYTIQTNLGLGGVISQAVTDAAEIQRLTAIHDAAVAIGDDPAKLAATAMQNGVSQAEIAAALGFNASDIARYFADAGIPAFATGGLHKGGLRIVGERGPELEATGPARYWNANDTASMLQSGGASNDELVAEMKLLRAAFEQTVVNTGKTQRSLERIIQPATTSGELSLAVRTVS